MENYLKKELYNLLKKKPEFFDFILNVSLDGLWYWDLENPENKWISPSLWKTLDYDATTKPHLASAWHDIINQEDLAIAFTNFNEHIKNSNHPIDQDVRCTHSNGSIIWIRCRAIAIRNEQGEAIRMLGTHQNITSLKESELQLAQEKKIVKKNKEKYLTLYNQSPFAYQSLDQKGTILEVNDKWLQTLGYTNNEVLNTPFETYIHPDSIKNFKYNFKTFLKEGVQSHIEYKLVKKNGDYIIALFEGCVKIDGDFPQTFCTFKNIRQEKETQKEISEKNQILKINEERHKLISKISTDYSYAHKINEDWSIELEWNFGAFEEITGYKPEVVKSMDQIISKIHPNDIETYKIRTKKVLQGETVTIEIRILTKNGNIKWIKDKALPQWNASKKRVVKIIGVAQDITIQKETELKLIENNVRFKMISDISTDYYYSYSVKKNSTTLKWCFGAFEEITGYKPEEMKSIKDVFKIIHPNDLDTILKRNKNLRLGKTIVSEFRIITRKGDVIWIKDKGVPQWDKNHEHITTVICTAVDITKQKKAELALLESEQKFRGVFEGANVGIALSDKKVRTIDANNEFLKTVGYTYNEFLSLNIKEITHPDDAEKEFEQLQLLIDGKIDSYRLEKRLKCKNGSYKWLDALVTTKRNHSGEIVGFLAMTIDISDRIEIGHKLKQNKERLRLAIEGANIGTWDWHLKTNKVYTNKLWLKKLGYHGDETIHDMGWWTKKTHPKDVKTAQKLMKTLINENKDKFQIEFRIKNKKGAFLWIQDIAKVTERDADGNPIRLSGIHIDISDRKKAENDLILAKEKAEESNKLKSEFLHNMSHEIRTPMNGIIGFSELLSTVENSPEKQHYYTTIIQNSSKQLLRIIDDILEISRLDTKQIKLNKEEFSLNNFILELFSVFDLKSKERNIPIYVKNGLSDHESVIKTDKTKLHKIISNLLENALKFTNKGFIELGYYIKGASIILFVKDTGIGIDKKNKEKIFERFSQETDDVASTHGGLGLGLSISKENARLLGGTISFESEKGKGATFYLHLPYNPVNIHTTDTIDSNPAPTEYTVLIAEDEEVNYLYFESVISSFNLLNLNLIHAKNGQEAVDICTNNKNIDLIFMDIKMPVLNGYEATKTIKELDPMLPIVAQTAYSTLADEELAYKHGCDAYISKPIESKKIIEILSKYLKISS